MIKYSGKIIHGLSTDPKEIATALHAKGFISDRILQETYELPEINQDKGRRLYTAVLGVVANYPHRYKDFIAVLQQNTRLYSELLDILMINEPSSIVSALSGKPTLDELCSLPIEKVWYPLGIWLGVEKIELQRIKQRINEERHLQPNVEMFKAFLEGGPLKTNEFELVIGELPREKQEFAKELLAKKASKSYGQLVRALVKVGKKKVAEEICSNKGKLYYSRQIICHYYRCGSTRNRN